MRGAKISLLVFRLADSRGAKRIRPKLRAAQTQTESRGKAAAAEDDQCFYLLGVVALSSPSQQQREQHHCCCSNGGVQHRLASQRSNQCMKPSRESLWTISASSMAAMAALRQACTAVLQACLALLVSYTRYRG